MAIDEELVVLAVDPIATEFPAEARALSQQQRY